MTETVAVFGIEGQLGSSVAKCLAKHYLVKAVSWTAQKPENVTENSNLTVYHVNPSKPEKIREILDGVSGVFVTTNTDFNSPDGYNEEVFQGQLIAEACSAVGGVKHVILHAALSVVQILGLSARHMDAKCAIGEIMKRLNVPMTRVILPCFYEQLLCPPLKPKKLSDGSYGFAIAAGNCALDWMSIDDVGDVVASIFNSRDEYLHKTLGLSADKCSISEVSALLTKHIQPISFVDTMMTVDAMRQQGYPGAADLANMFDFCCRVDQRTNINLTQKLNTKTKNFEDWIKDNIAVIKNTFNGHL